MSKSPCPCESGQAYQDCCAPFLQGKRQPTTAEQLMRSRYTAYVKGDSEYLLQSWHPDSRPASLELQPEIKWLGLKIVATHAGGDNDRSGTVEFVARNKLAGRGFRLHEISRFMRQSGRWYYLDGELQEK